MQSVREEKVQLRGTVFVKQVDFKPGVEERGSYGCAEWELEEKEVTRKGTGESEMEQLVSE